MTHTARTPRLCHLEQPLLFVRCQRRADGRLLIAQCDVIINEAIPEPRAFEHLVIAHDARPLFLPHAMVVLQASD